MEFPAVLNPGQNTRAGRMIEQGGRVVVSVRSKKTGEHISIKFQCCRKNESGRGKKWPKVPLGEATHVFISVPNASDAGWDDKVGTFYPRSHRFYEADNADPARVWAACAAAHWLNGEAEEKNATYHETNECGRCGRELTDPVSVERGIGPECFGKETGSQHQTKNRPPHTQDELVDEGGRVIDTYGSLSREEQKAQLT